jgi:preprotein translocase subunit SecY
LVIEPGVMFRVTTIVTLVTGTMFVMWLGEQITERGLGNGISILIFAGIVSGLPSALAGLLDLVRTNAMSGKTFQERYDTPYYCSPSSESYWSM